MSEWTHQVNLISGGQLHHGASSGTDPLHQQVQLRRLRSRLRSHIVDAEGTPDQWIVGGSDPDLDKLARSCSRCDGGRFDVEAEPPFAEVNVFEHLEVIDPALLHRHLHRHSSSF